MYNYPGSESLLLPDFCTFNVKFDWVLQSILWFITPSPICNAEILDSGPLVLGS